MATRFTSFEGGRYTPDFLNRNPLKGCGISTVRRAGGVYSILSGSITFILNLRLFCEAKGWWPSNHLRFYCVLFGRCGFGAYECLWNRSMHVIWNTASFLQTPYPALNGNFRLHLFASNFEAGLCRYIWVKWSLCYYKTTYALILQP